MPGVPGALCQQRSTGRAPQPGTAWLDGMAGGCMTNGLILLFALAVLFAFAVGRVRRRLGMAFTARIFAVTVSGFAIAVLVLWATQRH